MEEPQENTGWRRFHRLKPNRKKLGKRARKLELATLRHAHTFLIKRWVNVREVRRHMLGWLVLVALIIGVAGLQFGWYRDSYTTTTALPGGTYAEGVVGPLEIINPLFASTTAEKAAAKLVFASLLSYDQQAHLQGELAKSWEVSPDGKRYTLRLRDDARWHDAVPVTSKDVKFTIDRIKNPETRSPLRLSWEMIDVRTADTKTVIFDLPEAYAPFPHALTFGVLPEHLLKDIQPGLLRESAFNKAPIGSGPFAFRNIQTIDTDGRKILHLKAFADYFAGIAKLDRFQLHIYKENSQLKQALISTEVNAASDVHVKKDELDRDKFTLASVAIDNGAYAIFRNDGAILRDVRVRQALQAATDTKAIIERTGGFARPLHGPIISSQFSQATTSAPTYDLAKANALLDAAGWARGANGIRIKEGRQLSITTVAIKSGDYPLVLDALSEQWSKIGVKVDARLVASEDVQQSVLRPRAYDVLVYELAIGADPDVYAYWHSSQASQTGLNFANYSSRIADDALESARFRSETDLRSQKYKTFTEQWLKDAPAIALYQPVIRYASTKNVRTIPDGATIVDAADRYRMVKYWTVEQGVRFTTP